MIELIPIRAGRRFTVCALSIDDSCPSLEFIDDARSKYQREVDKALTALFQRFAEEGPLFNIEKNRKLTDDIWELKTKHLRILYFFDEGRVIICTNGYFKQGQKTPQRIIHTATEMYRRYKKREQNEVQF
jgi:phage-related protein